MATRGLGSLLIDSVCVLEHVLPFPIEGDQVGLYVWGSKAVSLGS